MLAAIKKGLRSYPLWLKIRFSKTYIKLRAPKFYKTQLKELDFYKSVIGDRRSLIFDVGANKGHKSYLFSKLAKKVVLFEPGSEHLKVLKARFANNSQFIINDCALSSKPGKSDYFSISNNSGYNTLSNKHINTVVTTRGLLNNSSVEKITITTDTLDNFIATCGIPDYIKIDVEGFELEVILGLNVPVPIISFEANLPEFLQESLQIIEYLDALSESRYYYNYSIENKLELDEFIPATDFKRLIADTKQQSLEVYCKLY